MKPLLSLILFALFGFVAKSQTLNYTHFENAGTWQTITILSPPGNKQATSVYYNSNNSNSISELKEVKSLSKDGNKAVVVNIGSDQTKYLLILASDGKHIILSDDKQMFTSVFTLDSNIYNPPVSNQPAVDYAPIAKGLIKAFAYLLL